MSHVNWQHRALAASRMLIGAAGWLVEQSSTRVTCRELYFLIWVSDSCFFLVYGTCHSNRLLLQHKQVQHRSDCYSCCAHKCQSFFCRVLCGGRGGGGVFLVDWHRDSDHREGGHWLADMA